MISCIFKLRVWVTRLSLRLRLITHISVSTVRDINSTSSNTHWIAYYNLYHFSNRSTMCNSTWRRRRLKSVPWRRNRESLIRLVKLGIAREVFDTFCFPPLAGNCKNTDLGGKRRINDGVNYKKKFRIGKKVPRSVDPSCEVSKICPQA